MYTLVTYIGTYIGISWKRKEEEATGAVHFNPDYICLCCSAHKHTHAICVFVCVRLDTHSQPHPWEHWECCGSPIPVFSSP